MTAFLDSPRGRIVLLALRVVVAGFFFASSITALQDPSELVESIGNYRMLPDSVIGPMAVGMPLLELLVGLALVSGVHARGASLVAAGMLVVFAIAMIQAIVRGIDLDCGCFGHVVETRVSWLTVLRNVALTIASLVVVMGPDLPLWPLRPVPALNP